MSKPQKDKSGGPHSGWAELLALGLKADDEWTPGELEAALDEQISVPMEFELAALRQADANALRARAAAHGLVLKNLHDLFQHHKPPKELLVMAKDYFKANIDRPQPGLPADVARVLYYLTIAVAWLRLHERISTLSDAQILSALDWVRQQRWVGDELLALTAATTKDLSPETQ